jgi:hypothetical protein
MPVKFPITKNSLNVQTFNAILEEIGICLKLGNIMITNKTPSFLGFASLFQKITGTNLSQNNFITVQTLSRRADVFIEAIVPNIL